MIVRSWHGIVPLEKASEFREYLMNTGVREARATKGNLGAYIHSAAQNEYEHFYMVSYWDSMGSVEAFAGKEPHFAVTYPEDCRYSLISDPIVLHHEVQYVPDRFPIPDPSGL